MQFQHTKLQTADGITFELHALESCMNTCKKHCFSPEISIWCYMKISFDDEKMIPFPPIYKPFQITPYVVREASTSEGIHVLTS